MFARLFAIVLGLLLLNIAPAQDSHADKAIVKAIDFLKQARAQTTSAIDKEKLSQAIGSLEMLFDPAEPRPLVTAIPVGNLDAEYKTNPASADKKYKGNNLEIVGCVHKIEKELSTGMYYLIMTPEPVAISRSECKFFFASDDELTKLRPGMLIAVRGKCMGRDLYVVFVNCKLAPRSGERLP